MRWASALTQILTLSKSVTDTRMSDEIVHNLDGCEISLVGDDLDPERESLLLDMASLQQRGLELTNTSAYITIAGQWGPRTCPLFLCVLLPMIKYREIQGVPLPGPGDISHLPSLEGCLASRLPLEEICWGSGSKWSFLPLLSTTRLTSTSPLAKPSLTSFLIL